MKVNEIKVTDEALDVIIRALMEIPWRVANPIIVDLTQQANAARNLSEGPAPKE